VKGWCVVLAPVLALAVGCAASSAEDISQSEATTCATPGSQAAAGVSLRTDLLPIFDRSCAFSSCHGSGSKNGVSLKGDATTIRMRLVGVKASHASMDYVTAGAPEQSFLMRKLEGSLCGLDDAGERMPKDNDALSTSELALFRGWIAAGADDN
jgi:hypothetical protein